MLKKVDFSAEDWKTVAAMKGAWSMTRQRCYNPNCRDYFYYGGRGIRMCDQWADFEVFLRDMGLRPKGMTLDRIDVNGDYEPSNCRWATRLQQSNNMRATKLIGWLGEWWTVAEWERRLGWKPGVLKARFNVLGYSLEEAFTKPVKCGEKLATRKYPPKKPIDRSKLVRGMAHPFTLLTRPSIAYCKEMRRRGASYAELARELGVTDSTVRSACLGLNAYKEAA